MKIELGRYKFEFTQEFNSEDEIVDLIISQYEELDREVVSNHIKQLKLKFNDTNRLINKSKGSEKASTEDDNIGAGKKRLKKD